MLCIEMKKMKNKSLQKKKSDAKSKLGGKSGQLYKQHLQEVFYE